MTPGPTEGVKRKPRFWVHAREFRLLEEAVWEFEEARAVIYGAEADKEEIILESRRGRFEEDRGATLKEGVKAYIGAMDPRTRRHHLGKNPPKPAGARPVAIIPSGSMIPPCSWKRAACAFIQTKNALN